MKKKWISSVILGSLFFQVGSPMISFAQETEDSIRSSESTTKRTTVSSESSTVSSTGTSEKESKQVSEETQESEKTGTSESSSKEELPAPPTVPLPTPQVREGETKDDPPLTLPNGYEAGTKADQVTRTVNGDTLALYWLPKNAPMLMSNRSKWIYSDSTLDVNLLINKSISLGTGGNSNGIFDKTKSVMRVFGHNENSLYQAFYFDDTNQNHFKMEVIQTFNEDHSADVTYTLHNLNEKALQIGLQEYAAMSGSEVSPLNNMSGYTYRSGSGPRFSILPKDFSNWSATTDAPAFGPFTPKSVDGVGWETGLQNGDPAKPLKENTKVNGSYAYMNMKSVGKEVAPNASITFQQQVKYSQDQAPDMTLDQTDYSALEGEDVTINGEAWDEDTTKFKVSIVNKTTQALISSQDMEKPLGEHQSFGLIIPAKKLVVGKNELIVRVSDQWGEKKETSITVTVTGNLPNGYEAGTQADQVTRTVDGNTLALTWLSNNVPMLTHNGKTWVYDNKRIDMSLLVNKSYSLGVGDWSGGIFWKTTSVVHVFGHNENSLYQAFYFDDINQNRFKMEVIQTFNEDHSADVTYTLHNLNEKVLQIGLQEYADLKVGSDRVPVTPINNFRGLSLQQNSSNPRLSILPKDFENWSASGVTGSTGFGPYTPKTVDGKGWETGFQNGDSSRPLKENAAVNLGDSYLNMKSVGKEVAPNGNISFQQQLKYGQDQAPDMTLDQTDYSVSVGNEVTVNGEAWDEDTDAFKVVLANKATNTVIASQDFTNVGLGQKQPFKLMIPAEKLLLGKNEFIARVSDQWGEKKEVPVTVTVEESELSFTAPEVLDYKETKLTGTQQLVPRVDPNWKINVVNTKKVNWQVKAQATAVESSDNKTYKDALTFVDKDGEQHSLAELTLIAEGTPSDTAATIQWEEEQGVLFVVNPATMKADTYAGTLTWLLEQAP
ncbi:hypothetical protein B835_1992 [Enterococcus mundtii 3F]|uniref:hypothetical protein n=1 Tax=Enterococcus mundtii TaxID=53346 RepID=UPI0023044E7B|nr:hypothetical protein [Enterococcus mundtii]MDA9462064.1 hypothetical protein [Enterococcus mundtii 3F]